MQASTAAMKLTVGCFSWFLCLKCLYLLVIRLLPSPEVPLELICPINKHLRYVQSIRREKSPDIAEERE